MIDPAYRGGGAFDSAGFSRTQRHALRGPPGRDRRRSRSGPIGSSTSGSTATPASFAPPACRSATGWPSWPSTTACSSSLTTAFLCREPSWWPSTPGSPCRSSSTSSITARPGCWCSTRPMPPRRPAAGPVTLIGADYESGLAAAPPYGADTGRRVVPDCRRLHQRDHRTTQRGHVPPPGRLSPEPGHGVSRRAGSGQRVPLDPADVPLQRLVLHLGRDGRRRHPPVPAPGRPGDGVGHDRASSGHPLQRRSHRADHAGGRPRRGPGPGPSSRSRWRPEAPLRRRPCSSAWRRSTSTSPTCTG